MTLNISIIVCTYNRANAILKCLESIEQALHEVKGKYTAEIIVVNNASKDHTSDVLQKWVQETPFQTQIIYEEKAGIAFARNTALKAVQGQYIASIDDDCIMDQNYFVDMMHHYENDPDLCLRGGRVELGDPNDLPLTIKTGNEKKSWKKPMPAKEEGKLLGSAIIGCNVTMQKKVLDIVGFFDESIAAGKIPAGEDSDLIYRNYLKGIKIEYVPNMIVKHFHGRKTEEERKKLLTNYAIGNGALSFKYLFIYPPFAKHIIWQTISSFKRWRRMFEERRFST